MSEVYIRYFKRILTFPLLLIVVGVGHSLYVGEPLTKLIPDYSWTRLLFPFRETVELVVDLPNVPELKIPNLSGYADLGYLHTAEGGQWVARVDHREYFVLTPRLRDAMLQVGRLRELPPVPATPWSCYMSKPAIGILALIFVGLVLLVSKLIAPLVKPPRGEGTFLAEDHFQQMNNNFSLLNNESGARTFGKRQ